MENSSLIITTCLLIVSIINFTVGYRIGYRIGMRRSLTIIVKELEDWNEL